MFSDLRHLFVPIGKEYQIEKSLRNITSSMDSLRQTGKTMSR
ncbi:hypothetical protein MADA3029_230010 [Vibrio nigripulchritudo MADA3029]|uniref:Uncharacterized protein n=1 Tax=Vibrio nigripulchritudo SOn1 TaxID=1238450 RepID=A0AAV2VSN3_9VIBR|nr:hypothetical protein VIBNIMADA3020_1120010 [Vibrio nigripulchritudo MADA3020]CCN53743.1 hypothetical protein VIBNIMADA3021_390022 [Vibrio nigripulchritudo MADA3021]CCN58661.1 hypothetical protein MADA3029_230010 [Vibrio nigripulchritudo MADA3029]CCO47694.1 hypothetical protein VIBNISOn1_340009 [Vibrio nigripulchritudo SOn1]